MSTTFAPVALDLDLAKRLSRASERIDRTVENRDRLILLAYARGASLRDIGDAAGLTHVGVKKLVERIQHDYVVVDKDGNIMLVADCKVVAGNHDVDEFVDVIRAPHHRDMPRGTNTTQ